VQLKQGIFALALWASTEVAAESWQFDERGSVKPSPPVSPAPASPVAAKKEKKFYIGVEGTATAHIEEGLDHTKGDYSVSYTTLGGSITSQYHFPSFYFETGAGLMTLLALKVNDVKIDMSNRSQLHLPFYIRAYYKLDPLFAIGVGATHLIELSMYVDSQQVPHSTYNHFFLDLAAQVTPQISETLLLTFTAVVGINLIPGRQNIYSVGDLLHMRFQFNVGLLYRLF
jgi:hypothetical protein